MAVIDELLVGLGFEYDDQAMEDFKSDLSDTLDIAKKFVKTMLAGAAAITALTIASTNASDEQGKEAQEQSCKYQR